MVCCIMRNILEFFCSPYTTLHDWNYLSCFWKMYTVPMRNVKHFYILSSCFQTSMKQNHNIPNFITTLSFQILDCYYLFSRF